MVKGSTLPQLTVTQKEAEQAIRERIERGKEILASKINSAAELEEARQKRRRWCDYNEDLLRKIFSDDFVAQKFRSSGTPDRMLVSPSISTKIKYFCIHLQSQLNYLESIIERLGLFPHLKERRVSMMKDDVIYRRILKYLDDFKRGKIQIEGSSIVDSGYIFADIKPDFPTMTTEDFWGYLIDLEDRGLIYIRKKVTEAFLGLCEITATGSMFLRNGEYGHSPAPSSHSTYNIIESQVQFIQGSPNARTGDMTMNIDAKQKYQNFAPTILKMKKEVMQSRDLSNQEKAEIIDNIEVIDVQAQLPAEKQKPGFIKAAEKFLKDNWETVGKYALEYGPKIHDFFDNINFGQ